MTDVLFESRDLRARAAPGRNADLLVVTFSSYHKVATLDRPGFGADFLAADGIAAVHVVARVNRWFQHPELPALLAAVRAHAAGYARTISYGSSMGGFAALAYGTLCGADAGLAISPQATLDARAAPFETRWRADARAIRGWHAPGPPLGAQVIVYDPHHAIDAAHAGLLAAAAPTVLVRVPHGGHPAGVALARAGLLKRLVRDVAAGAVPDLAGYAAALRAARATNAQYLYTLARRLGPHHAARAALAAAALAHDASPHTHVLLGDCLAAAGDAGGAERAYRGGLEANPRDVDALAALAGFLARRGRAREARALVAAARAADPGSAALARLAWRTRLAPLLALARR